MERTVVRADRLKTAAWLTWHVVVLAASLWWAWETIPALILIVIVPLISWALGRRILRYGKSLFDPTLIVFNEDGITDFSYGLGFIPWEWVEDVQVKQVGWNLWRPDVVELQLKDLDRFFEASDDVNRSLLEFGEKVVNPNDWLKPDWVKGHDVSGLWLVPMTSATSAEEVRRLVEQGIHEHGGNIRLDDGSWVWTPDDADATSRQESTPSS